MGNRTSIVMIALIAAAGRAAAEPVVLALDGADIYVDLGARDGVGAGAQLELLHEVVAKDPRTGNVLRDRFALGALTVVKSGDRLSVARADDELRARVLPGDRVRLVSPARTFVDPWTERIAARNQPAAPGAQAPAAGASTGGAPADHAELARAAWQDTLGKPPEQRIERWQALLRADPHSPYRAAIQREIATLRGQITAREEALAGARAARSDDRSPRIAQLAARLAGADAGPLLVGALDRAVAGEPIGLVFVVRAPARPITGWLYARARGELGFTRSALVADGDAYLRGTIDAALVRGDAVEWYVEAAFGERSEPMGGGDPAGAAGGAGGNAPRGIGGGEPRAVLGSQTEPRTIAVEPIVDEPPIAAGRSHIDVHVDYVDFDGKLGGGFDQYYQAEIDFTYRFVEPVYAVRLGFGTLSGVGGPKDVIDGDPAGRCLDGDGAFRCARVSFSYVYTELELRLRKNAAVMLRPQAGLLTSDEVGDMPAGRCNSADISGCRFLTGFGARARLRLGDEDGTNLVIGAGFTSRVGTLLEASYRWRPAEVVPVQLSVQVTDLPVPEDFGVRLIADVGWKQLSWFYPSARLSYQARDIDHAGVSGGLAMNFDW